MNETWVYQESFIPLLAGLPWLAALLGSLFSAIFTWAAQYLTKRLAFVVAAIAAITLLTTALFLAVQSAVATLEVTLPSGLLQAAAMFGPSNLDECLTAYVAVKVICWAYDWNVRIIQYKLF